MGLLVQGHRVKAQQWCWCRAWCWSAADKCASCFVFVLTLLHRGSSVVCFIEDVMKAMGMVDKAKALLVSVGNK